MTTLKFRFMGDDGVLHGRGLPDLIPTGQCGEPIDPPNNPLLWFDTTVFGQSFARYKMSTISGESNRYVAVELDTAYGGNYGSGVVRYYQDSIGTWSTTKFGYMTVGQPMIYSFKIPNIAQSEASFKADARTWLDSKPEDSDRTWVAIWHEFDKELGQIPVANWAQFCVWFREVLDEVAYADRTDIRFGFITTGGPFAKSTKHPNRWDDFYDAVTAIRGDESTFEFGGADRYNPAWDGAQRYMPNSNWGIGFDEFFARTGKPMIIGEGGSPRPVGFNSGQSIATLDVERAAKLKELYEYILAKGFYDAFSMWRVPAVKNGIMASNFSSIMITPTGYNAELAIAGVTGPLGGVDAQPVVDVHAQYCHQSMLAADPQIPFYIP